MWDAHTMSETLVAARIGNSILSPLPGLWEPQPGGSASPESVPFWSTFDGSSPLIHLQLFLKTVDPDKEHGLDITLLLSGFLRLKNVHQTEFIPTVIFFKEDMCTVRVDFRENSNHSILPVGRSEGTWSCVLWEKSWGVCYMAETQGVFEIAAREQQQISWHPCPASSTHSLPGLCALKEELKKVKMSVIQSCPTLCDPMDCSLPAPLSMGFPRQEYWSGLPFLLQGIFPTRGSNLRLLHCRQILYHWATWEAPHSVEQRTKCAVIPLGPFREGSIFWLSLVNQNTMFAVLSSVCSSQNRQLK